MVNADILMQMLLLLLNVIYFCVDIDEELCDGQPALINPVTGKEYNCHRGNDICPTGSYCHILGTIAECCGEGRTALIASYIK